VVPVEDVFDDTWLALCRAVDEAPGDEARVRLIEDFLLPRWRQARPEATRAGRLVADWSHSLALRAATSGLGRSLRQVERRIKQWTGQPLRELRGIGRSEQAFFEAVVALKSGSVNWSDVASNTGYADQSHLCRQTRRITGFAPEELRRLIATDECFWAYRLWGYSEGMSDD
jgi:AraC-like DNA-binding protein